MKLLTEIMDVNDLTKIKILFEANGIPLFISNEDAARNMGLMYPARKYGVFILYEEQFHDAKCLLEDENHIVENQIDMDEHRKNMRLHKPSADDQLFKTVMMAGAIVVGLFVLLIIIQT